MSKVANWNLFPSVSAEVVSFTDPVVLVTEFKQSNELIARGNGRSYGDASLGGHICSSLNFRKLLSFDKKNGILCAQSGVLLSDLLTVIVPHGWFLPVTPGTKFITLGGAIAADVHGKNHHKEGAFSRYVIWMDILLANGKVVKSSKTENLDLFKATCGGMGLSGIILNVCFQLKKIETSKIAQRQIKARDLSEILELFDVHRNYTYSVAWIDCLKGDKAFGRSILMLGEHALKEQLGKNKEHDVLQVDKGSKINVPFFFPEFAISNFSVKTFNALFYLKNFKRDNVFISNYESFFYPLDAVLNWNRIYGKRGFIQYQFVLPKEVGKIGLIKILSKINSRGWASFLAVLKLFGAEDEGYMSFPMEGYTLALDIPIRPGLFEFLDELDQDVLSYGGRIYLAKDARMKPEILNKSYPNLSQFIHVIKAYDPEQRFKSELSKRLLISEGR